MSYELHNSISYIWRMRLKANSNGYTNRINRITVRKQKKELSCLLNGKKIVLAKEMTIHCFTLNGHYLWRLTRWKHFKLNALKVGLFTFYLNEIWTWSKLINLANLLKEVFVYLMCVSRKLKLLLSHQRNTFEAAIIVYFENVDVLQVSFLVCLYIV